MEDYRLQQSGQEVQDILNGAAMQVDLTAEETRAKAAEKQNADDIDAIEEKIPSGASSSNKFATESDVNDASQTLQGNIDAEALRAGQSEQVLDGKIDAEETRAKAAEKQNADDIDAEALRAGQSEQVLDGKIDAEETRAKAAEKQNADDIDAIEEKIPSGASSSNKLATEGYVNDKVSTDTATFRGTYNSVSDLHLSTSATHEQIAYLLGNEIHTADNNDYCFVQIPTSAHRPTEIAKVERYKFNGEAWAFEYELNNSGFTTSQWAAINSGITSGDVTKLAALPTSSELTTLLNGKQDTLTFDNTPTENSNNPVKSGGVYSGIKTEEERAKAAEKQNADDIDAIEEKIPSGATSSNKLATASDVTGEATTRENADAALQQAIEAILLLIPSAATSLNQLADKAFVNSSIATSTATFRGTYNLVNDLGLMVSATHAQIATALAGAVVDEDNNDYAFVQVPTSDATPTQIAKTERYKFNGTAWEYEYDLNNSGYTADQWAAINSGITAALVTKLSALPTNTDLTTALGVLTEGIAAINAKIPSAASSSNKLVDNSAMVSYIGQIIDTIDATFNVTSTDGHVTVQITQVNGVITNVAVTTSDIASDADLSLLAGRITTAEGNISTNAQDIAALQAAYAGLTQNDCIVVAPTDTWPVSNPSQNIIYRVVDRVNTPPQYYSDYMWNGTTMVLMAQYNNAIDDEPTPGSNNLVKSGGVAANIVYDISEANAVGGTLATYADLAAALGVDGANIPASIRKGGMSVKFVCSSDNNYVQYFCNAQTFTTDTVYWEKINLEKDLCKEYAISEIKDGYWQHIGVGTENQNDNYFIAKGFIVNGYNKLLVSQSVGSGDGSMGIVFYKENGDFVSGVNLSSEKTIDIPSNAHHANITFKKEVYENMGRFVFHLYDDIGGLVSEINSIASEVDGITFNNSVSTTNLIPLLDSEKINGKGIDTNGVLVNTSWTKMSSRFIEVIPGSYIQYRLRGISGLVIAFYTASNESSYISNSGVASGTAYIAGTVKVPSTAKYMRFCSTDWSNECYIYTNNIATVNFIGALDKRDVCLLHANIVDGYYINSVNGITAASLYGYYELPVIPKETIILYGGVETGSNTIVLGYYLDDILVATENLSNHYKQKCTFIVPDGVNNVKVSFNEEEKTNLYFMHDYSSFIKGNNSFSYKVGLTISANNTITQGNAPFCNITKSDGIKVSGTGTTTITLTLANELPNGTIISLGVKYPYSTQEIATVSVDGGNAIEVAGTTQKTKSGLMFKMQGEAYQRVNIKYHAQTISIVVTTTEATDDWELWISDSVIVNDTMPLAPVCYIYDGGHWDGHVMYNNESISIWTLHRRLGIPYSIAATTPTDTYQPEVLEDIESGFAELITRIGGRNNTLYKQNDADVIDGIISECRDHEADNMGAVLATHAFDKDVLRCVKMSGIEFLRTYPTYDDVEKYGSRFGDYDLPLISGHSVSSTTLVPESFMGFPVILWAHGVGDPQSAAEQELSDFYEDKTNSSHLAGASTIDVMTKILNAQAVGNAAAMKTSDFIAFCKKYK